jgi:hypothetical protein
VAVGIVPTLRDTRVRSCMNVFVRFHVPDPRHFLLRRNNSAQNTPLVAYPSGLESPLDIALNRKSSGLPIGSLTSPVDALRGGSKNPGPIKVAGTSFGTKGRGGEVVQEACDRDGEADEEQQIGSGSINRGGRSGGVRKPSILDSFKAREGVDEKRGEHNEGSSGWGTPSRKFSTVSEGGSTTGSESGVRKKKAAFLRMASGSVKNMFGGSALSKSSFKGSLKNVLGLGASKNEDGEHEEGSGRHHHGFLQRLGSGIMNIAEAITHVDGRTCTYQGLHFVQNETLGIGDTTGGITAAKRMAEWDGLERASRAATYMLNQGLPGQAWQRGARQADYSILKYLIDDPERLLGEWMLLCFEIEISVCAACTAMHGMLRTTLNARHQKRILSGGPSANNWPLTVTLLAACLPKHLRTHWLLKIDLLPVAQIASR